MFSSRMTFRIGAGQFLLVLLTITIILSPGQAVAIENLRKYAGIVVDAKSGQVLYDTHADDRRYPASLAKVMTLYVLFQELEAGTVRLSDRMVVSKHAASAVPTKLGLKPGWTITVEDAMKSLVTRSANDMARVIAEHISGSESKFAERMTATARALGMSRTTYRNASGLPDGAQVTTARDQATLGVAIYQHFPQYYDLFQTKSFTYGGRTYGNHNRLLGFSGVDGIKTGYINASGSNLLTAARRDDRHIVVAAIGFNSGAARDSKVRDLVKSHISKGRKGSYIETARIPQPGRKGAVVRHAALPVAPMPYPEFRLDDPIMVAGIDDGVSGGGAVGIGSGSALQAANIMGGATASSAASLSQGSSAEIIGAWLGETFSLGAEPLGDIAAAAPVVRPVVIGAEGQPVDLITTGSAALPPVAVHNQQRPLPLAGEVPQRVQLENEWVVQIGTAPSKQSAQSMLDVAAGSHQRLENLWPHTERVEKNGIVFYRARLAGFEALEDASEACTWLRQAKLNCLVLQS